jgi:predicted Zn-dependent protease
MTKFFSFKTHLVFLFLVSLAIQLSAQDKLSGILEEEVMREMSILKKQEIPAYYLAYRVDEVKGYRASAQFGVLINSDENKSTILTITLRVGSPKLDNFHAVRDIVETTFSFGFKQIALPTDNNPDAVKQIVWKATNDAYQDAVSKFSKVKANVAIKIDEEDKAADFTMIKPNVAEEPVISQEKFKYDVKEWEKRIKRYSVEFLKDSAIFQSTANFNFQITRKYYVSSSGEKIVQNSSKADVFISGTIKAKDGMELPLYKTYFAYQPEKLPADIEMVKASKKMVANLIALKNAPVAEPFSGPALLSAEASGVFFHEIFGHRVEGLRMKSATDAQTFKKKIGELVLPKNITVYCDPLQKQYEGQDLNGYYQFDDEGVKAERVNIVESGVLKNFLMGRTPINGFPASNGHGRAQAGMQPVTRQSNLVIETTDAKTNQELRNELIRLCKERNAEYGYLFQEVTGGFTMTGRFIPNSFNVTPNLVYRVYADGRADEIVRGVDLIGTPLSIFSQIDLAGGSKGVFNGTCGAESGSVPVSCCSPMILVKMIETQKKAISQTRPFILARPTENF